MGAFFIAKGVMLVVSTDPRQKACPSAGAFAHISAPIMVLAPPRFSTTTSPTANAASCLGRL